MTLEEIATEARIWVPSDFKGNPYESRPQLFATMEPGDSIFMWAPTYIAYASIRGSAYGYGNGKRKKFHTKRETSDVVRVWRER